MSLRPLIGAPGSFYEEDEHGRPKVDVNGNRIIFKIRDFHQFETAEPMYGTHWFSSDSKDFRRSDQIVIHAWRFTCATWPPGSQTQQAVRLVVDDKEHASISLSSILTVLGPPTGDEDLLRHSATGLRVFRDRDLEAEKFIRPPLILRDMLVKVELMSGEVDGSSRLCLHLRGVMRVTDGNR